MKNTENTENVGWHRTDCWNVKKIWKIKQNSTIAARVSHGPSSSIKSFCSFLRSLPASFEVLPAPFSTLQPWCCVKAVIVPLLSNWLNTYHQRNGWELPGSRSVGRDAPVEWLRFHRFSNARKFRRICFIGATGFFPALVVFPNLSMRVFFPFLGLRAQWVRWVGV